MAKPHEVPAVNIAKILKEFRYPAAKIELFPAEISRLQTGVRNALAELSRSSAGKPALLKQELAEENFALPIAEIIDEIPLKVTLPRLSEEQTREVKLLFRDAILRGALLELPGFGAGLTV